jgi:hypothetical protein
VLLLALLWLIAAANQSVAPAIARDTAQSPTSTVYDVFVGRESDAVRVYFVDARTGLSTVVPADGSRHTLLAEGVIFQEAATGIVRIATPDGRAAIFAAIQPVLPGVSVEWAVSPHRTRIAWTVTVGGAGAMVSDLYIAQASGEDTRLALHTTSTQGLGVLPLMVADDGAHVFYTRRTDLLEARPVPLTVEDVFRLDVATGLSDLLPEAEGCPCPVAFSADGIQFARLEPLAQSGFVLRMWDLPSGLETLIAPPRLGAGAAFDRGGATLILPDGRRALYTAARGTTQPRNALILAEAGRPEQRVITDRLPAFLRPVDYLPGSNAVLLIGSDGEGTYKVSLEDGAIVRVSAYTYLGQIPVPGF